MLGHAGETVENCPAMQCAGFQITLLRGAEWAATGKVTQKVPLISRRKNKYLIGVIISGDTWFIRMPIVSSL